MKVYIYNNTAIFNDIAKIFKKYIPNSIITTNYINNNELNYYIIISGLNYYESLPKYYDVYQFEQLDNYVFNPTNNSYYIKLLKNAQNVYDWSKYNIEKLNKIFDLNIKYLPILLYSGHLYPKIQNKKYVNKHNVVFIGSINKRRNEYIKNLNNFGLINNYKIDHFTNKNIEDKNNLLSSAKIVLNIHYYDNSVLEIERINDCLKNRCFIISELSKDDELNDFYKNKLIFVNNIEECNEKIIYYLNNPTELETFRNNAYEIFINDGLTNKIEYPLITNTEILITNEKDEYPENEPITIATAKYEINYKTNEKILKLNSWPEFNDLPFVSLITITKNREVFYPFMLNNFMNFKYPMNKIEWIILDDSDNNGSKYFSNKRINYIYSEKKYESIAEKRNDAIKNAKYDIIIHIDDDDYYFPMSLYSKVKLLLKMNNDSKNIIQCIGTTNIGIYNMVNNNSYLSENPGFAEASLCYFKSFWINRPFYDHFNGEGFAFMKNRYFQSGSLSYEFNLIVLNHNKNYTGKNRQITNSEIESNEIYKFFDLKTKDLLIKIREDLGLIMNK
jgi:hypothetical protein